MIKNWFCVIAGGVYFCACAQDIYYGRWPQAYVWFAYATANIALGMM